MLPGSAALAAHLSSMCWLRTRSNTATQTSPRRLDKHVEVCYLKLDCARLEVHCLALPFHPRLQFFFCGEGRGNTFLRLAFGSCCLHQRRLEFAVYGRRLLGELLLRQRALRGL